MSTLDQWESDELVIELDELSWVDSLSTEDPDPASAPAGASAPATSPAERPVRPPAERSARPPAERSGRPPVGRPDAVARLVADRLHEGVAAAHAAALDAQNAIQLLLVEHLDRSTTHLDRPIAPRGEPTFFVLAGDRLTEASPPAEPAPWPPRRTAFTPLARTRSSSLDHSALELLAAGRIAEALGPTYAQPGGNPRVALSRPLVLDSVDRIDVSGGSTGSGLLEARCRPADADRPEHYLAVARQAAEVSALVLGLHLCFADCELTVGLPAGALTEPRPATLRVGGGRGTTITVDVVSVDLVPLPWLAVDVTFRDADGSVAAEVHGLSIHAAPEPGAPLGPTTGGVVTEFLGRFSPTGEPALLSEFNIAHIAHGDQAIAMGPEFAAFSTVPAVRLPSGQLLLVDRVMEFSGRRGEVNGEARWRTEYDSPADAWYYRDSANAGMPNCVFMEFSLQAAAFLGPYLGGTLLGDGDEPLRLRNLEGQATLLRDVDLAGRTISQESSITSTSITPGALLQDFAYESSLDGEPFYRGTSLFGYFDSEALDNQVGLDGGRRVPTWLEENPGARPRTVDVARRRRSPGRVACSSGRLALLDTFEVVDGGGKAGLGYLHCVQPVDPRAWYFDQHFYLDPVIPGSFGVETLIQAVQEWAVDTGLDAELDRPEFVVPVGSTLRWKYRGQFLRSDSPMTFEVHVLGVERRDGRVRITAEASVWKPGMRIYRVENLTVELRDPAAPAW